MLLFKSCTLIITTSQLQIRYYYGMSDEALKIIPSFQEELFKNNTTAIQIGQSRPFCTSEFKSFDLIPSKSHSYRFTFLQLDKSWFK